MHVMCNLVKPARKETITTTAEGASISYHSSYFVKITIHLHPSLPAPFSLYTASPAKFCFPIDFAQAATEHYLSGRAARDVSQPRGAAHRLVDDVPAIHFTPRPVVPPVAATLQIIRQVGAVLAGRDATVVRAPFQ